MLCALTLLAATIPAQFVLGFQGSLNVVPFDRVSTLDAHVQRQDLELRETVLNFVDSGILTTEKSPQFSAPKTAVPQGPASKASPPKTPALKLAAPDQSGTSDNQNQHAGETPPRVSPFRKWIKPQTRAADAIPEAKETPQLARRSINRKPIKLAQPLPLRQNSAAGDEPAFSDTEQRDEKEFDLEVPAEPADLEPSAQPPMQTEVAPVTPTPPASKLPPLTRSQINLRKRVRSVLTHYYNRPLNTRDRSPWELMHAMLAFEAHSKVLQGGPNGKPITAVGWLCYNQACKRRTLMYVDDDGKLQVRVGPALQGHRGQLLAMLAQSRINENYPMLVEGNELKIADLIEMEKRTCYPRTELTFKLIALMHYLDSNETWLNDQGREWSIPQLISEELRQPVRGAACGGTHRLSGLTLAYKTREKRGEPVDGQYLKAKKFVSRYQQYAYRLQNRDGSFSTEWFRGPGNEDSLDRKLKTTGHILEWLLYAAGENELKHWRTTKAVNYLSNIMQRNRYKDWEAGPLGHAVHALLVYDRLVFSPYDEPGESPVATRPFSVRQETRRR